MNQEKEKPKTTKESKPIEEKPKEVKKEEVKWSIMGFWNQLLESTTKYPAKERDYISMSDIGKNYWDRYQKMTGVEVTNPFDDRTLRVFAAGDEIHNLMKNVFKALGIFINSQDDLDANFQQQWSIIPATKDTLKVLGKYDILVGGKVDVEQTRKQCETMGFSPFVKGRTIMMAEFLKEKYPDGLPKIIYEIKSVNSLAFWNKKDYLGDAYPHHKAQCFGYLKANNIPEGRVLYVSKDDLMVAEFPVLLNDKKMDQEFGKDLREMTYFFTNKIEPPKPENVNFDNLKKFRFQLDSKKIVMEGTYDYNWEVARSQYFTKMTGFKDVEKWKESIKGDLQKANSELKEIYVNILRQNKKRDEIEAMEEVSADLEEEKISKGEEEAKEATTTVPSEEIPQS